jgi:hypothetical protein
MKRLRIEIVVGALLVLAVLSVGYLWNNERKERIRLDKNQSSLLSDIEHYKTKSGESAVMIQQLTLEKGELKKYESELVDSIKKLGFKLRRLESITQVSTKTDIRFVPIYKDSIVTRFDTIYKMPCYEYKDEWVTFLGCKDLGEDYVEISQSDSIIIVGNRIPKRFIGIPYGVKSINLDIVSMNPYSTIKYARNIVLKK